MTREDPLRPEFFRREDESDDALFYADSRLVTHIDDAAIEALKTFYGGLLPSGARVLDLMSSWVSHLPENQEYAGVAGLGMNQAELERNPRLSERVVQDLNHDQELRWPDLSFDGAVVTVSVQYLVKPVEVFREVGRVLVPGGPFAVAYSKRCFPTKAVAVWRSLSDNEHAELIGLYFRLSGAFDQAQAYNITPPADGYTDPLWVVVGRRASVELPGDPPPG